MSVDPKKIIQLRQLLDERFGHHPLPTEEVYATGLASLDEIGVPQAAITELISASAASPGISLLFYGLLHAVLRRGDPVILIDGKDGFTPKGLPAADHKKLLWMRCHDAWEAMKAADLAIRDGNVPLVVLLLTLNPENELRRIPATSWHRLQMLAEKAAVTVLVFSPQAQVGCARLRLSVAGAFPLDKLHRCRGELLPSLQFQVERRRLSRERRHENEEIRRPVCA